MSADGNASGGSFNAQPYIIGVVALGTISGIFSPLLILVRLWLINFLPAFAINSPLVANFIASLLTSTIVIAVAGVPAALYERITGKSESTQTSLFIWVASAAVLSMPAVTALLRIGF
ncbi:MAG: hypothetical protein AAGD23_05855 [Pseudomonadota bacterium]